MRLILASALLVSVIGCASSGDSVDDGEGSVNEGEPEPAADDDGATDGDDDSGDDGSGDDDSGSDDDSSEPEPGPTDDDDTGSEPEPDVPDVDVPIPVGEGGAASEPVEEPEPTPNGGTGGANSTPEPEPDVSTGGADPGNCPRPLDDYTALGGECDLIDFDCENYYRDECGCGCDDVSSGTCTEPADNYVLDDPAMCLVALFSCEENEEPFFDDCGCGCRPAAGADTCTAPAGRLVELPSERVSTYQCFGNYVEPQVLETADDLEAFLVGCDAAVARLPDFEKFTVFGAVVPERPYASLAYVVEDEGVFHVGVQAAAYCGGAAPPNTLFVLEIEPSGANVEQVRCPDTGMCDPDLLPPSAPPMGAP